MIRQLILGIAFIGVNSSFNPQTDFVRLEDHSPHFYYDMRYATENNFVGESVYDCGVCLLRPEVAQALVEANNYFMSLGFCIQIYDCYRPFSVQKKLWEKVPNPAYVANPYDGASVHNRGAAVDLTLVGFNGSPLDFGTDYDFFGKEAHVDYLNHPAAVLARRNLLAEGLAKFGFKGIRTEWWHYSYTKNSGYPIADQPLPCKE